MVFLVSYYIYIVLAAPISIGAFCIPKQLESCAGLFDNHI